MPRLSRDTWDTIRGEREAGQSFGELSKKFYVDKAAIVRRAKLEGWGDGSDVAEVIRRKVSEKLTGITPAGNLKKRVQAIDSAADASAEIIKRHREETSAVRERLYAGLRAHKEAQTREQKQLAFEDLKAAKIASETLINIHRAERQAWSLDAYQQSDTTIVIERDYGKNPS